MVLYSRTSRHLMRRCCSVRLSPLHAFQPSISPFKYTSACFITGSNTFREGPRGVYYISTIVELLRSRSSRQKELQVNPHPGDEVDAQRPLAPNPYDSTYQKPPEAPDAHNISRERFHQFMYGKPQRFSKELKVTFMGCTLAGFGIGMTWLTAYIMRPDDFEFVEEERRRIQEAKDRLQQRIENAKQAENKQV